MPVVIILENSEKKFLLGLVRNRITHQAEGKIYKSPELYSGNLQQKMGAFVTLHKNKSLRGCIGYIEGNHPLQQTIEELALAAAFEDPRFPPVQSTELPDLEIEISILSPLKIIHSVDEIEVGRHGLIIEKNFNRGVLLPQVATEYKWDKVTFLRQTCLKAGLPESAWQEEGATLKIFSAEIFSESDFKSAVT
jgi:AmmeMemoRadiSam system protein A